MIRKTLMTSEIQMKKPTTNDFTQTEEVFNKCQC